MIDPHSRTPYNTKNFRLMKYKMDVKYWPRVWEQERTSNRHIRISIYKFNLQEIQEYGGLNVSPRYIYNRISYIVRNIKTRLKIISSHAIRISTTIGKIRPPLLCFCRLLFSFLYIVFDSRVVCIMITCNHFDSWEKGLRNACHYYS